MNTSLFEGKWKQIRGKSKEWWSLINDIDLGRVDKAPFKLDKYVVLLQVRYGYTKQFARAEIQRRLAEYEAAENIVPGLIVRKTGIAVRGQKPRQQALLAQKIIQTLKKERTK
jgi:hypothetical protein